MDLLSNPWIIGLFTFIVGIGAGMYLHRLKYSDSDQTEKLEDEIQSLEQELEEYKSSVADHFSQTSTLLSGLTENYVKVYQHLAEGSQSLANTEQMALRLPQNDDQLTSVSNRTEGAGKVPLDDDGMEMPRDYAPKPTAADAEGTLSEAFSINQDRIKAQETLPPAEKKLT